MNIFQPIMILLFAFLAVFGQATLTAPRNLLGSQIDLLPALMVYASLNAGLPTIVLLAIFGGVWADSFSANPLGVTILPLFTAGFLISLRRDVILRDLPFTQLVLGAASSVLVPALTLLLLLSGSTAPLIGWGTLWQSLVMCVAGSLATPVIFALMGQCKCAFGYQRRQETSFRPDREIRHGKH